MFDAPTRSVRRVHATRGRPTQAPMPQSNSVAWGASNIHASQAAAAPSFFLLSLLLVLLTARRKMDADAHGWNPQRTMCEAEVMWGRLMEAGAALCFRP